jgi:antitoxin (DNA-binding transcriptional repressor) of toxin-antitoxin stability system
VSIPAINQRDLRLRSKEIMDSVEAGQPFVVTRDGHDIAHLVPLRRPRAFVRREEFLVGALSAIGRTPRRRVADLQIAATAAAHDLPLYTTNPHDFEGLDDYLTVIPVPRPHVN